MERSTFIPTKMLQFKEHSEQEHEETIEQSQEIIEKFEKVQVYEQIEKVGNEEIFQQKILVFYFVIRALSALINYQIPYIFYTPDYYCIDPMGNYYKCEKKIACSKKMNYVVKELRSSLVTQSSLYCEYSYIYTNFQSFLFVVSAISVFIFSYLSDKYGRSRMLNVSSALYVLSAAIVFLNLGVFYQYLAVLLQQLYYFTYASIINVYIGEFFSQKMKSSNSNTVMIIYQFVGIAFSTINVYITDYQHIQTIIALPSLIIAFGYLQFPETPFYYYKNGNIKKYLQQLLFINNINNDINRAHSNEKQLLQNVGITEQQLEHYDEIRIVEIYKRELSFFERIQKQFSKNDKINLLLMSSVVFSVYLVNGIFVVSTQFIGVDDLYVNMLTLQIGSIFGFLIGTLYSHLIPRKYISLLYYVSIAIFGIIFNLFTLFGVRQLLFIQIIETIFCFFLKALNSISITNNYIWLAEIFPSKIRGTASGIIMFFGRGSYILTPYITSVARNNNLHPLFFMPLLSLFFTMFLFKLPETFDKNMKN